MKSPHQIILLVTPLLFLVAGCSEKAISVGVPPAPVLVGKVEQKTVPVTIKTIGTVQPYATVSIKSQVDGQVTEIHFSKGQDVKKGDLLFTIDPRPFEATLKSAEAQTLKAKNNLERGQKLLAEHTISPQEFDDWSAVFKDAEATLDRARLNLQYCSITAPIAGRTGDVMVDPGNLVRANDDPVLVTINQITPIYVSFALAEKYLPEVRKHMAEGSLKVKATVPSDPASEEGVVSFVDNKVDTSTGTIRMKGTFENQERRLWPGQFVDVLLTVSEEPNATVVPAIAIQTGQSGQYVFVVKPDQTAEMRPVVIGRSVDDLTVIEKGVETGETVVTDGQLRVVPGGKVEIKKELQEK